MNSGEGPKSPSNQPWLGSLYICISKMPCFESQTIRTSKHDQTRNTIRHRAGDPISTFGAVKSHFAISALNSRVFITFSCKWLWVKSLLPWRCPKRAGEWMENDGSSPSHPPVGSKIFECAPTGYWWILPSVGDSLKTAGSCLICHDPSPNLPIFIVTAPGCRPTSRPMPCTPGDTTVSVGAAPRPSTWK